jgi:transcriptional regulator with XRE-family HTH domain
MQLDLAEENLDGRTRAEIKAEMARQDISGSKLARLLEWRQTYLSRRLRGQVNFSLSEVESIAWILGVSLEQLMPPSTPRLRPRRRASLCQVI